MNVSLRQIEVFYTCCQLRHFRKASEKLYMSPAAVSKQMTNFEKQLGYSLFEMVGKKVHLTTEAKLLLPFVKQIIQSMQEFNQQSRYLKNDLLKPIRVSFGSGLENIVFDLIKQFRCQQAGIKFEGIVHRNREKQFQDLINNTTNIHFATKYEDNSNLVQLKLFTLQFYLVCEAGHPLANKKTSQSQLDKQVLITIPDEKNRLNGFPSKLLLESYPSIKEAILAQLGIGFLPHNLIDEDPTLHKIKSKPLFTKSVYIVYRKNSPDLEVIYFINFLKKHYDL